MSQNQFWAFFHKLWGLATTEKNYDKKSWMEMQSYFQDYFDHQSKLSKIRVKELLAQISRETHSRS